jgi:hypothetical protein
MEYLSYSVRQFQSILRSAFFVLCTFGFTDGNVAKFAEECGMTGMQFKHLKKKAKQAPLDFSPPGSN